MKAAGGFCESDMELFKNVPKEKQIDFLYDEKGNLDVKALLAFFHLEKAEIAVVFGIKADSVRYDERMPIKMKQWGLTFANVLEVVARNYDGNLAKTKTWFMVSNPCFNFERPLDMIKAGKLAEVEAALLR